MKNFKLLLFAFTLMFSVSAIAAPTSDKAPKAKKEHKTTADKKDKKFVSVTFYYDGLGSITSQSSWTTTGSCPITGNSVLCSIEYNTDDYGGPHPNSTVLNKVAAGLVTGGLTPTTYTIDSGKIRINLRS